MYQTHAKKRTCTAKRYIKCKQHYIKNYPINIQKYEDAWSYKTIVIEGVHQTKKKLDGQIAQVQESFQTNKVYLSE